MAHFAKVNQENIVEQVIVIDNNDCGDLDFPQSESIGQSFIAGLGLSGRWLQTSYNNNFRNVFAGIGYTFDPLTDSFYPPKPQDSSEINYTWDPVNKVWQPTFE